VPKYNLGQKHTRNLFEFLTLLSVQLKQDKTLLSAQSYLPSKDAIPEWQQIIIQMIYTLQREEFEMGLFLVVLLEWGG
jgi:hypothetical protein